MGDRATRSDYVGCGLWALGFLVLVVVSFAVGVALRPDSRTGETADAVSLLQGGEGDSRYEIKGLVDETGDPCVSLLRDDREVAGQCGFSTGGGAAADRYVVTSTELDDGTTVVFAPVPRQAERVRLDLADGSTPEVEVRTSEVAGVVWFLHETDSEVAGPAEILDADGEPVPLPR